MVISYNFGIIFHDWYFSSFLGYHQRAKKTPVQIKGNKGKKPKNPKTPKKSEKSPEPGSIGLVSQFLVYLLFKTHHFDRKGRKLWSQPKIYLTQFLEMNQLVGVSTDVEMFPSHQSFAWVENVHQVSQDMIDPAIILWNCAESSNAVQCVVQDGESPITHPKRWNA